MRLDMQRNSLAYPSIVASEVLVNSDLMFTNYSCHYFIVTFSRIWRRPTLVIVPYMWTRFCNNITF